MSCCGHPNTCEQPCFHGGQSLTYICDAARASSVSVSASTLDIQRVLKGYTLIDPVIQYTQPEPRKPSLDEQCEAAMARLKAHIASHCAEHREAIRANSNYAIGQMHQRHDNWRADLDFSRYLWAAHPMRRTLPGLRGKIDMGGYIQGFGLYRA